MEWAQQRLQLIRDQQAAGIELSEEDFQLLLRINQMEIHLRLLGLRPSGQEPETPQE